MVPRVVSQHTRNQSEVSVARLWKLASYQQLLQTVCHPCSSYGVQRVGNHYTQHWECRGAGRQPTSHSAAANHKAVGRMELSDFQLLGPLPMHLAGKQFAPDTDKNRAVISWLQILGTNFFYCTGRTSLGAMLWQMFKISMLTMCRS